MPPSHAPPVGVVALLKQQARRVPPASARVVRELAQKECEADIRANDALLSRANQLLAATGVAASLLVGLTKDAAVDTAVEKALLLASLVVAIVAAVLVLCALRVTSTSTYLDNANILGADVQASGADARPEDWVRDHELSLARHYCEVRIELFKRHQRRATMLQFAQGVYLLFLAVVAGLGLSIAL